MTIRHIRQPLNNILALGHINNWDTRNLPNTPLKIAIVGGNQINAMFLDAIDNAVVSIGTLVVALEALPALVAGNAQGDAVFGAEFFQLGHDARGDYGRSFGIEEVHERFVQLKLAVHRV